MAAPPKTGRRSDGISTAGGECEQGYGVSTLEKERRRARRSRGFVCSPGARIRRRGGAGRSVGDDGVLARRRTEAGKNGATAAIPNGSGRFLRRRGRGGHGGSSGGLGSGWSGRNRRRRARQARRRRAVGGGSLGLGLGLRSVGKRLRSERRAGAVHGAPLNPRGTTACGRHGMATVSPLAPQGRRCAGTSGHRTGSSGGPKQNGKSYFCLEHKTIPENIQKFWEQLHKIDKLTIHLL